jgi:hypothetical protein
MFALKSKIYLDEFNKCYKKIIIADPVPNDEKILKILKTIPNKKLSPFQETDNCCPHNRCISAFVDPNNTCRLLCFEEITLLFQYLLSNGYTINTDITRIMLKGKNQIPELICFVQKN